MTRSITLLAAGVIALTKGLARDLAPFGINVNAVGPTLNITDMTRSLSEQLDAPPIREPAARSAKTLSDARARQGRRCQGPREGRHDAPGQYPAERQRDAGGREEDG